MSQPLNSNDLRSALRRVIDPEIYENIVDLGLVYQIDVEPDDHVVVTMTLTTPQCPMGPEIMQNVERTLEEEGAQSVAINLVWEPMWTPEMMTDRLKAQLGVEPEPALTLDPPPSPPPKQRKKKGFLSRIFGW